MEFELMNIFPSDNFTRHCFLISEMSSGGGSGGANAAGMG